MEQTQKHATPQLAHFNREDYRKIYEPSSDTFLFLDALEKEEQFLRELQPSLCLEIG